MFKITILLGYMSLLASSVQCVAIADDGPWVAVPSSKVPSRASYLFHRGFAVRNGYLRMTKFGETSLGDSCPSQSLMIFHGLSGWFRRDIQLSDADKLNLNVKSETMYGYWAQSMNRGQGIAGLGSPWFGGGYWVFRVAVFTTANRNVPMQVGCPGVEGGSPDHTTP